MCGGGEVLQILLPPTFPHLFPHPGPHHDLPQLLHLPGGEEHGPRDHLPPPVALTVRLCPHVGTFPHPAPPGENFRPGPDPRALCVSLPAGPHAQSAEVRSEKYSFIKRLH